MPGHFNNRQLLGFLFGPARAEALDRRREERKEEEEEDGDEEEGVAAAEEAVEAAPEVSGDAEGRRPLYPFTRHLALICVRDLHRLCLTKADHLRARCLEDEDLAPLTPPHPLHFHSDDGLSLRLLHRVLLSVTGLSASPSALSSLRRQAALIGRVVGRLDTESKKRFLDAPYDLHATDNAAMTPAVLASLDSFSARQARSWFSDRKDPLAHLRFSAPLSQLDGVGRLQCEDCKRKSAHTLHLLARPLRCASHSDLSLPSRLCVQGESVLPRLPPRGGSASCPTPSGRPPRLLRHVPSHTATHPLIASRLC